MAEFQEVVSEMASSIAASAAQRHNFKRVKIGAVQLGIYNEGDPDKSKPNPRSIVWSQEFEIIEHKIVGMKPLTQCLEDEALWKCDMEFTTLDNKPEVQDKVIAWKAGPYNVETAVKSVCMYIESKTITQEKGTDDYYQVVHIKLKEANDGSNSDITPPDTRYRVVAPPSGWMGVP